MVVKLKNPGTSNVANDTPFEISQQVWDQMHLLIIYFGPNNQFNPHFPLYVSGIKYL